MRYQDPYMKFIMTPPVQDAAKYEMYQPAVGTMRLLSGGGSLGDVPMDVVQGDNGNSWIMPVVVIVVSAMALMTLYAVLSKR